jgi:hypothetical protein
MATRQVGDETLSPRADDLVRSPYQVIARQDSHRLSLQDVADEAGVRRRVAGAAGPPEFKAVCHQSLRTLLGAGR